MLGVKILQSFNKTKIYVKVCYKTRKKSWKICRNQKSPYLCIVFFIVLDLRLTRLGYGGIPFFMSFLLQCFWYFVILFLDMYFLFF